MSAALVVWCDGAHGARFNMARDAALLERAASAERGGIVLRLFGFAPPGITLGRNQDPARELDLERVVAAKLEWAVRPTGGRAIYHDEEWTFSLATRLDAHGWARTASDAYARTGALLARALVGLGVPAELSPGGRRGGLAPRAASDAAPPCFASTARHELTVGGRKLAGIAQRAVRGALLQQGSVLLGESHLALADFLAVSPARREEARAGLAAAATAAGLPLQPREPLGRLAEAVAAALPGCQRLQGEAGAAVLGLAGPGA